MLSQARGTSSVSLHRPHVQEAGPECGTYLLDDPDPPGSCPISCPDFPGAFVKPPSIVWTQIPLRKAPLGPGLRDTLCLQGPVTIWLSRQSLNQHVLSTSHCACTKLPR